LRQREPTLTAGPFVQPRWMHMMVSGEWRERYDWT